MFHNINYDQGRDQLGGRVSSTRKWIGATEIFAALSSFGVKTTLLDFHRPTGANGTHPALFRWVKDYFQQRQQQQQQQQRGNGRISTMRHPLYFQHQVFLVDPRSILYWHLHLLVAECNSIRGFAHWSVRPSVGQAFLKNREFKKIHGNSTKFSKFHDIL